MVTQRPLEAVFMVRIHVGQPSFKLPVAIFRTQIAPLIALVG